MSISESAVAILAASAMPLTAAVADQIDIIPVTAGITGSFVAGLRPAGHGNDLQTSRVKWLSAVVSGASVSVCCSPFLHTDLLGLSNVRSAILVHFLVGLLGTFLVDAVLANPMRLLSLLGGRVSEIVPPSPPKADEKSHE